MSNSAALVRAAHVEYDKSKFESAKDLFNLCAVSAHEENNLGLFYKARAWAAHCLTHMGQYDQALINIMDCVVLENEHPEVLVDEKAIYLVRSARYYITSQTSRNNQEIVDALDSLREFFETRVDGERQILINEFYFLFQGGRWSDGLNKFWQILAASAPTDSLVAITLMAIRAALKLNDTKLASKLCVTMEQQREDRDPSLCEFHLAIAKAMLARHVSDKTEFDRHLVVASGVNSVAASRKGLSSMYRDLRLSSLICDRSLGNPAEKDHPARILLSKTMKNEYLPNTSMFRYHMAVLDYRVACVAHEKGLKVELGPSNSLQVCENFQGPFTETDPVVLRKTRAAFRTALKSAKRDDAVYHTDWREVEVLERERSLTKFGLL